MNSKVSDLVARFLASRRLRHLFGIVGAGNAHLFDSIANQGFTQIVCVHHEQAATMAMQTYYRVTGEVGVALLTTGGGAANGVTGVVGAWMDSMPGVVISGNEASKHTADDNPLRAYGVQGFDSSGMVRKVTKWSAKLMDPQTVLYNVEKAFFIASHGRPGPCWVDIPMNIQSSIVDEAQMPRFDPALDADTAPMLAMALPSPTLATDVAGVLEILRSAKRPLLWLGHGIRLAGAQPMLTGLLQRLAVPALVSWSGIDMIDSNHPLVYGRAGVYGQRAANFILQNSDAVICIGNRMAIPQVGYDISELARGARIVVVDIDAAELQKYAPRYTISIRSDAKSFLDALMPELEKRPIAAPADWVERCNDYRNRYPWVGPEHTDEDGFFNSYAFMDRLNHFLKPDQLIVTDMGTALLSGHQVLRLTPPQRLMTSQGLGEMGYGLPAAIGASFATDGGEVLCLNCDGGMMMNLQELQTIAHHRLPIKIIIFNNDGYLMIKHTQNALFKGRFAGTDARSGVSCPDFSKLGGVFGFAAFQIRTKPECDDVLARFQAHAGPAICEVFMHPRQPLVPKLSLASRADGTLVSPPLEDLSPLLPREELRGNMIDGLHPKSDQLHV